MPTCHIEGCERAAVRWKFTTCESHYYRKRKYGTFADPEPEPERACAVDGCTSTATRLKRTLCETHYYRQYRTGSTELLPRKSKKGKAIPVARRRRGPCIVDGCNLIDCGPHGMCAKHNMRMQRHGDPHTFIPHTERDMAKGEDSPRWTGEQASYYAIHQRLTRARGRARTHKCIDCSAPAAQWSYSRTNGPGHRECEIGPYSVDLADYDPRCVSCHKKFDLAHLGKATTPMKENIHA